MTSVENLASPMRWKFSTNSISCRTVFSCPSNTLLRLWDSHGLAEGWLLEAASPRGNEGRVRGTGSTGESSRRHKSTVCNIFSWFCKNLGANKHNNFRYLTYKSIWFLKISGIMFESEHHTLLNYRLNTCLITQYLNPTKGDGKLKSLLLLLDLKKERK